MPSPWKGVEAARHYKDRVVDLKSAALPSM